MYAPTFQNSSDPEHASTRLSRLSYSTGKLNVQETDLTDGEMK